jgi:hypothetical protein
MDRIPLCHDSETSGDDLPAAVMRVSQHEIADSWPATGDCLRGVSVNDRDSPLITVRSWQAAGTGGQACDLNTGSGPALTLLIIPSAAGDR